MMTQTSNPTQTPNFSQELQDVSQDVTDKMILVDESVRGFIRQRPVAAVGVALLAGFLVGRIVTRL